MAFADREQDGGPNPDFNSRLVTAITAAKKGALSKTSIESAIAKGQGKSLSGAALESVLIEAMLPFSVAMIVECQTDQKARVLQDIRHIISRHGGTVTPTAYLFEKKGRIVFDKHYSLNVDDILEEAIEAGALDVDLNDDGQLLVDTEPSAISSVAQSLAGTFKLSVQRSSIIYDPSKETMVSLNDDQAQQLENVISLLDEDPSVQDVYVNAT